MSGDRFSVEGSMVRAESLPGGRDVFAVFEVPEEGEKFKSNTEAVKSSDPEWQRHSINRLETSGTSTIVVTLYGQR